MLQDVGDLAGAEPHVDGQKRRPQPGRRDEGDAEIVAIRQESGNDVPGRDVMLTQGVGEVPGLAPQFPVGEHLTVAGEGRPVRDAVSCLTDQPGERHGRQTR